MNAQAVSRAVRVLIPALFAAIAAIRVAAVFLADVNWDEFALLHRAVGSVRSGVLAGGGRPGLGTLVLLPFADGCRDAVTALVHARHLWTAMVLASAVAFGLLLRSVLPQSPGRWMAVMTGVGLWTLAPAFLRHSVEVRTDQPAILLGLAGGLALVASARHRYRAPLAGILLGAGFLFSQKLLYVAGLVGVLAVGQLLMTREQQIRDVVIRDVVLRAVLAAAGFLGVVAAYRVIVSAAGSATVMLPVAGGLSEFAYYRQIFGWNLYRTMLPTVVPQLTVIAGLVLASLLMLMTSRRLNRVLVVAWLVALVGLVVLLFHAGRFPYFYLVLGLFPAAVGALIVAHVYDVARPAVRRAVMIVIWVPLTLGALGQAAVLTVDAQQVQRESLAFVERNFTADARGFQNHGAFICRDDPDPFPVRFAQTLARHFGGPDGAERTQELIAEFRSRPVAFMIVPHEPFPEEFRTFAQTRYVHYRGAVHVPGRLVSGSAGWSDVFEVIVPGEYVWRPSSPNDRATLQMAGTLVGPMDRVVIDRPGVYRVSLPEGGEGMLVLLLPEPPDPDPRPFFRYWR